MLVLFPNTESLREAINVLQSGGIVAHATETCYGFACDLTNEEAVRKLFALKKRPEDQPVSALFISIAEAKNFVEWNQKAEELARKYLPGPLTIVLPVRSVRLFPTPEKLSARTIGVRVSSHPVAQKLVETFGSPLSTTSANLHGQANPYSVEEILAQFSERELQPDLILNGGVLPRAPSSTVITVMGDKLMVVRQGGLKVT